MAKNIAYDSPIKEFWIYYPGKNWELGIMTNNPSFEDERNATQILPRTSYVYEAITTADNMVKNFIGSGSKYLMNYRHANDTLLVGSNSYKLNVPSNVLAEQFWSVDAYDNETRSLLKNDARSGITSVNLENVTQNNDGSYDIYFGPESLAGQNGNWIKTNPDEGFFVIFRLYGSTEPYYDKGWQLPNIELVKGDIRIHSPIYNFFVVITNDNGSDHHHVTPRISLIFRFALIQVLIPTVNPGYQLSFSKY